MKESSECGGGRPPAQHLLKQPIWPTRVSTPIYSDIDCSDFGNYCSQGLGLQRVRPGGAWGACREPVPGPCQDRLQVEATFRMISDNNPSGRGDQWHPTVPSEST